jgi:hypothetical protein
MTKATLIDKLSEAIVSIENGTLHPEVSARTSYIESVQEIICGIEDGELGYGYKDDEDTVPDYMVDCILDNLAEDLYKAQVGVDSAAMEMAMMNMRTIVVAAILFMALYN